MKVKSWSIVIGGCLSVVLALSVFKYNQIQAAIAFGNSFPEPMESVELAIAKQVNWQKTVMATGEVVFAVCSVRWHGRWCVLCEAAWQVLCAL